MDDVKLQALEDKVAEAKAIKKRIDILTELIASCNADIGFLNVSMNYKQQNEVYLQNSFTPREQYDMFKTYIKDAAIKEIKVLEAAYKNLE